MGRPHTRTRLVSRECTLHRHHRVTAVSKVSINTPGSVPNWAVADMGRCGRESCPDVVENGAGKAGMRQVSYASGVSDVPLVGRTIGADLGQTVSRFPDREALVDVPTARRWTYREFDAAVNRVATGLLKLGLNKGDRVGIWAPNCAEWAFVQYATARLGAILVNINPAYRTHELAYVLRQAGISVLVSSPEFKTSDYRGMVAEVREECPDLREVVFLGSPEWDRLVATGRDGDRGLLAERETRLSADDPINIQYTSGTTGF